MNGPVRTTSIGDVPRLLLRHRRKVLLFCVLVLASDLVWISLARRVYESEAKLYLRVGRESLTLDPSATTGQTVQLQQTQENQINSTVQILDSRYLAEQVVDQIGAANILAGEVSDGQPKQTAQASLNLLGSLTASIGLMDPESDRNRAIRKLQTRTSISSPRNSSIFSVQCQAESPALAQQITKAWVEIFLREHLRLTHTLGSYAFFSKQAEVSTQQLAAAERALRDAKSAAGLVSVEGQRKAIDDHLSGLRLRSTTNAAALESSQARVVEMLLSVSALSPSPLAQRAVGVSDRGWELLREKRRELAEAAEKEARVQSEESTPVHASAVEQRKRIEAILAAEPDTQSQHSSGSNHTYQTLHQALLNEQTTLAGLTEERRVLKKQEEIARQDLRTLNEQTSQIVDLERRVAILDVQYRTQVEKMEQARVQEALEQNQISSVNVVQPATFVERPLSPNKALFLVVGAILAVFGSVGVALLADYWHRPQVNAGLETPSSQVKPS